MWLSRFRVLRESLYDMWRVNIEYQSVSFTDEEIATKAAALLVHVGTSDHCKQIDSSVKYNVHLLDRARLIILESVHSLLSKTKSSGAVNYVDMHERSK